MVAILFLVISTLYDISDQTEVWVHFVHIQQSLMHYLSKIHTLLYFCIKSTQSTPTTPYLVLSYRIYLILLVISFCNGAFDDK